MRLETTGPVAPVLVLGIGNPSRGDDALGPLLVERLAQEQAAGALADVELLTDFQLQPEHALDLRGRVLVIIADAATACAEPFELKPLASGGEPLCHSTHSTSPGALLRIHAELYGPPPPTMLLLIRGYRFELGDPPAPTALHNLATAYARLCHELTSHRAEKRRPA